MNVIEVENGKPIFNWCPDVEEEALEQMKAIAKLPFVHHCALMPDAHLGMEMNIGGVVSTIGVIVPTWVGSDCGCGVSAVKTTLKASTLTQDDKDKLLHSFKRGIPSGFNHNSETRMEELKGKYSIPIDVFCDKLYNGEFGKVCEETMTFKPLEDTEQEIFSQLGTLGGSNHFLECQRDEEDNVWVMIHSGSRNIGKKICDYFDELAKKLNARWFSSVPANTGFLPVDTPEGNAYLKWMNFALSFAYLNRRVMLDSVMKDISHLYPDTKYGELINIHHNFANQEHHFGKNVWVHRKGATQASKDLTGIIPGNMGDVSFIVKGLGNPTSLNSCSHGAGRKMSRTAFNKLMNTPEGMKAIEDSLVGITHADFQKSRSRGKKDDGIINVSEAPAAYKNIMDVINNELDLIQPIVKLYPIINMKG